MVVTEFSGFLRNILCYRTDNLIPHVNRVKLRSFKNSLIKRNRKKGNAQARAHTQQRNTERRHL